ncbi:hypothetical protein QJS10_CPA10g01003 [Acorus calamus]|uniref:Uncharacterized protein n=1 Tax=Acorus calamus TaxID=4465 RepID=A0AAV9DW69_ACOCL|nr:hypothetical protein QJS10_CPA10g01003 [Acorus calamus]
MNDGGDPYDCILSAGGEVTGSQEELLRRSSFIGAGVCPPINNNRGGGGSSGEDASSPYRIPVDPFAIFMCSTPDSPVGVTAGAPPAREGDDGVGNLGLENNQNGDRGVANGTAEKDSKGLNGASSSGGSRRVRFIVKSPSAPESRDIAEQALGAVSEEPPLDEGVCVGRRRKKKHHHHRRKSKVSIGKSVAEDQQLKPSDDYRVVDRLSGKEPPEGIDAFTKYRYIKSGLPPLPSNPRKLPPSIQTMNGLGDSGAKVGLLDALKVFVEEPKRRFEGVDVLDVVAMKGVDLPPPRWWRPGGYEAKP